MENYKRKVTYFYQYNNKNVGTTAGFLKMEIRGENVKLTINIQEPSRKYERNPVLFFYHETGDDLSAVKICEIGRSGGVLTLQTKTPWRNLFDTGRDLYTFDGVLVLYNENDYYLGDFAERDRSSYDLIIEKEKPGKATEASDKEKQMTGKASQIPDKENKMPDKETELSGKEIMRNNSKALAEGAVDADTVITDSSDKTVKDSDNDEIPLIEIKNDQNKNDRDGNDKERIDHNINDRDKNDQDKNDRDKNNQHINDQDKKDRNSDQDKRDEARSAKRSDFEYIIENYPKLPMYNADELFDCVRIVPRDIGRLDIGNWKLGANSFLTHGYYTYQYLMLGRMRFQDGRKHAILGVPGVYTNREKYLANMFGFEQFIPVKANGMRTGQFGYWITELCQER